MKTRVAGADLAFLLSMIAETRSRVLIVEDEQCIRDVLTELFEVAGSSVDAAGSLHEAKQLLFSASYSLILTDLRLGVNRDGGLQVIAAAALLSPHAVIIALTAYPDDDSRAACLRLGATHFVEKPVPLERIADLACSAGIAMAIAPITERAVG